MQELQASAKEVKTNTYQGEILINLSCIDVRSDYWHWYINHPHHPQKTKQNIDKKKYKKKKKPTKVPKLRIKSNKLTKQILNITKDTQIIFNICKFIFKKNEINFFSIIIKIK